MLTFDGKGIVMRPEALREATAHKAASRKLAGRLSKGEKRHRKRMAELAGVYDLTRHPARSPTSCPTATPTTPAPGRRRSRLASGCTPASPTTPRP